MLREIVKSHHICGQCEDSIDEKQYGQQNGDENYRLEVEMS